MKVSKNRRMHKIARTTQRPQVPRDRLMSHESSSLPMLMASVFAKLRLVQRAQVLRRLLIPVGPMALVVLGGGAFADSWTRHAGPGCPCRSTTLHA